MLSTDDDVLVSNLLAGRNKIYHNKSKVQKIAKMKLSNMRITCILLFVFLQIDNHFIQTESTNETSKLTSNQPLESSTSIPVTHTTNPILPEAKTVTKVEISSPNNNTSPQQSSESTSAKPQTRLRLSIEEVASELSKKHLNLENENWRLKQTSSSSKHTGDNNSFVLATDDGSQPQLIQTLDSLKSSHEEEIVSKLEEPRAGGSDNLTVSENISSVTSKQRDGNNNSNTLTTNKFNDGQKEHYLHIESVSIASNEPARNRTHRRKKQQQSRYFHQTQHSTLDNDNELYQCHQYLRQHTSPTSTIGSLNGQQQAAGSKTSNHNQLPCSCELRRQSDINSILQSENMFESTWLSCDSVQLIGSHFYTQNVNQMSEESSTAFTSNNSNIYSSSVIKFSQRNSGLQTLHSQKFHYLLLNQLKYIDLTNNRIRQIRMDVFHGLENKLEYLNLANNLLGDSKIVSDDYLMQIKPKNRSPHSDGNNPHNRFGHSSNNDDKLIFLTDELSKLKKLKWLSLQNNQISALGASIFVKQSTNTEATVESELMFLDLSENLMSSIPTESLQPLHKLQVLNMKKNRITQVDQFSKFPKSLKHLDLSENLIKVIDHSDLIDLPDLIELNLSHNQLSRLDKTAFISYTSPMVAASTALISSSLLPTPLSNSDSQKSDNGVGSSQIVNDPASLLIPKEDNMQANGGLLMSNDYVNGFINMAATEQQANGGGGGVRSKRDVKTNPEIEDDSFSSLNKNEGEEMESDESALTSSFVSEDINGGEAKQRMFLRENEELSNFVQHSNQFNSTIRLNLSHNYFEQVPGDSLLKFANLRNLDLSYNRIRKLDSNYLCSIYNLVENLKEIDLSGNLLSTSNNNETSIDNTRQLNSLFGCLQKLEKLSLSTNRLGVSSPISSTDYDEDLNNNGDVDRRSSNQDKLVIRFGESFGNKFLKTIDLSDNQLTRMPLIEQFSTQPILTSTLNKTGILNGQQQQLNNWLSSKSHLEVLNMGYNSLDRLDEHDFNYLFNLRHLILSYNKLTNLPSKLMRRFSNLELLSLRGNQIFSLEPLNEIIERSVSTLKVLDLAYNRISEWPKVNKITTIDSSIATKQSALGASSNGVGSSGENYLRYHHQQTQNVLPFALEDLNLEGNFLTSANVSSLFDQLMYMRCLKTLNLSYNLLTRVKSEWFKYSNKNLRHLSFYGNKINLIDLGSFSPEQVDELISLDLGHNLLKELKRKTFDSMSKIQELNLGNNLIHTINSETFNQVNSLKILKLNNNKLTSWKCEYFSHLCNSISGNINADLNSLVNSNFYDQQQQDTERSISLPPTVSSLVELDLSHNSLSQLRANSISVHTKLVNLDLSYNKLSFIPHDLFKATTASSASNRQIQLVSSLKYLNLAHNRIQTIDNINFRPLKNLLTLDLSFNELQTLGIDVIMIDPRSQQRDQNNQRIIVSNNLTNLILDDEIFISSLEGGSQLNKTEQFRRQQQIIKTRIIRSNIAMNTQTNWPALNKLRYLNITNNQLTMVNQSLLSELSPFALLNLDLSHNYLDSESIPPGFYTKISASSSSLLPSLVNNNNNNNNNNEPSSNNQKSTKDSTGKQQTNYDMVFTLKLESLNLSHNRLNEFPTNLLDNHYSSMESCDLSHNRIQTLNPNSNVMVQIKSMNLAMNPLSRESNELILFEQKIVRYLNLASTRLYAIQQVSAGIEATQGSGTGWVNHRNRLANQTSELDLIRSISKPIDAPYVKHLNLSSNQLVWLAANVFNKMHSLQTLDLSNNQLTRLHLLNNQLSQTSYTLEYLNLNTNLFTNIDSSDFSQLTKLRYLDISNLLSLQKLNCRFIANLFNLRHLKMYNYPQLRNNLNSLLAILYPERTNNDKNELSERMRRKIKFELLMSTVGKHCLQDYDTSSFVSNPTSSMMYPDTEKSGSLHQDMKWIDLEELELEVLNDFEGELLSNDIMRQPSGFQLRNELNQLIGPRTERVSLYGLNLTRIREDSLLGITNNHLNLRISYTSLSQIPVKEIIFSIPKKTKLELDMRNNNIQSIDTTSLQFLDQLQVNNQILQHGDHTTIRLSSNPIRCDCQTRPLWLWLNQGRSGQFPTATTDAPPQTTTLADDTTIENSSPFNMNLAWHNRFSNVAQSTSDMECYYPSKLRGKLTQHVYYNDLVCKGNNYHIANTNSLGIGNFSLQVNARQSRGKKNETYTNKDSNVYSIIESNIDGNLDVDEGSSNDDDYLDLEHGPKSDSTAVRLTKFNKFPTNLLNYTNFYFLATAPVVPFIQDSKYLHVAASDDGPSDPNLKIGRRDQNSQPASRPPTIFSNPALANNYITNSFVSNIQYNKHRPNTQQKHSHYNTLNAFDQIPLIGKSSVRAGNSLGVGQPTRHSILTESDVMILTVISIAMTVMSFLIISICLFKYKLDRVDKSNILETHNKLLMAHAIHLNNPAKITISDVSDSRGGSSDANSGGLSSSSSSKRSRKSTNSKGSRGKVNKTTNSPTNNTKSTRHKQLHNSTKQEVLKVDMKSQKQKILVPIIPPFGLVNPPYPGTQNFLMRSPTIRRMQNFASNSADWFKQGIRNNSSKPQSNTYNMHNSRRHLFSSHKILNGSQLTTRDFLRSSMRHLRRYRNQTSLKNDLQKSIINTGNSLVSKPQLNLDLNHSRNSQMIKSMKTFGSVNNSARTQQFDSQDEDQNIVYSRIKEPMHTPEKINSQLPTIDVNGKFTYQTESQIESPIAREDDATNTTTDNESNRRSMNLQLSYNVMDPNIPTSTLNEGNRGDNIFILIQDHHKLEQSGDERYEIVRLAERLNPKSSTVLKMLDADECSRSSSPVAYGFMRSSPSNNSLSSQALNSCNAKIMRESSTKQIEFGQRKFAVPITTYNSKNNNKDEYSVPRKKIDNVKLVMERDDHNNNPITLGNKDDEQIVISRL